MMKENLQFYSTQPGFSNLHYKDLRENEHEVYATLFSLLPRVTRYSITPDLLPKRRGFL